jgi:hypothetical protein
MSNRNKWAKIGHSVRITLCGYEGRALAVKDHPMGRTTDYRMQQQHINALDEQNNEGESCIEKYPYYITNDRDKTQSK